MPVSDYIRNIRSRVGNELLLNPAVAALIRNADNEILFQQRADDGMWDLPSGTLEPGEPPAHSLLREVWEETGLQVRPGRIVAVVGGRDFRHRYPNGDMAEAMIVIFECHVVGGTLCSRDGESIDLRYFPADNIPPLVSPYPVEILFDAGRRNSYYEWDESWLPALK